MTAQTNEWLTELAKQGTDDILDQPLPNRDESPRGIESKPGILQDIYVFEKQGLSPEGKVLGRFAATGILPKFNEKLIAAGVRLPTEMFDEIVTIGAE